MELKTLFCDIYCLSAVEKPYFFGLPFLPNKNRVYAWQGALKALYMDPVNRKVSKAVRSPVGGTSAVQQHLVGDGGGGGAVTLRAQLWASPRDFCAPLLAAFESPL